MYPFYSVIDEEVDPYNMEDVYWEGYR